VKHFHDQTSASAYLNIGETIRQALMQTTNGLRFALWQRGQRSVKGWCSGTAADSQDTLAFSVLAGVRSMNEVYPLEKAAEAYDRMMSGKARFRVVLTTVK
jgi:D-arabinose 1-dehydrogenase-like Zn-dependent alcohol dehydrogenase